MATNWGDNLRYWIILTVVSLIMNGALGMMTWNYRNRAQNEVVTMTVMWNKSNHGFRPHLSVPDGCYQKEIVVDERGNVKDRSNTGDTTKRYWNREL